MINAAKVRRNTKAMEANLAWPLAAPRGKAGGAVAKKGEDPKGKSKGTKGKDTKGEKDKTQQVTDASAKAKGKGGKSKDKGGKAKGSGDGGKGKSKADQAAAKPPHERSAAEKKLLGCKFHLAGQCQFGDNSAYSHGEKEMQRLREKQASAYWVGRSES